MTSEKKENEAPPLKMPYSLILAQWMIASAERHPLAKSASQTRLGELIQEKNLTELAYWLHFNSFTKYQLKKITERHAVDADNPSEELLNQVNAVLTGYIREQELKRSLPKYLVNELGSSDYLHLEKTYKNLLLRLKGEYKLIESDVLPLILAKNRRYAALGRHANLEVIRCADYASASTVRKMAKAIANLAKGERKQFFYYHLNEEHAIGFDVERDSDGNYRIFCFESAGDPRHLEAVNLLYKKLSSMGLPFEIKSCRTGLQRDSYNCAVYTLAALGELAKYEHAFDYLPAHYEEDKHLAAMRQVEMPGNAMNRGKRLIALDVQDKISWVRLSDMPTKIIAMSQSYQTMEDTLAQAADFDLQPAVFIDLHKQKYHFNQSREQSTKYINQRRKQLLSHLDASQQDIIEKAYREYFSDLPWLNDIDRGKVPDFHQELALNDQFTLQEKLTQLEKLFFAIANRANLSKYVWHDPSESLTPAQFQALLAIRVTYLQLLAQKPYSEAHAFLTDENSMLAYRLEQYADAFIPAIIPPLYVVFKEAFKRSDVIHYYRESHSDLSELKIKNALPGRFQSSPPPTTEDVLNWLNDMAYAYQTEDGSSYFDVHQQFTFLEEALSSIKQPALTVSFITARAPLDREALVQTIQSGGAYVVTGDEKVYYFDKATATAVEIDVTPVQLKKLTEIIEKSREGDDKAAHEASSLSFEKPVQTRIKSLTFNQLNAITSAINHHPYSPLEVENFQKIMILRTAFLQVMAQVFRENTFSAIYKLYTKRELLFNIPDLIANDAPSGRDLLKAFFSKDMLLYCQLFFENDPPEVFNGLHVVLCSEAIDAKKPLSAEEITRQLTALQQQFITFQGEALLSAENQIKLLTDLGHYVLSSPLPVEEKSEYLEAIITVYITLLNISNMSYFNATGELDQLVLFPLLGDVKQKPMTANAVLLRLQGIKDICLKLKFLDEAFEAIQSSELYTQSESTYTEQQIADLVVLQEAYLELLRREPYDPSAKYTNSNLVSLVSNSPLLQFAASQNKKDTTAVKAAQLAQGKGRPVIKKAAVSNENNNNKGIFSFTRTMGQPLIRCLPSLNLKSALLKKNRALIH
ncbi:hypothetical protein GH742_09330 [Legionella sp. MW5194]|uniref:hypothetical protein n=1 Tax=Legionella sp. MW5194 TaxID=2662448 RepID=UPI00193EB1F0|nr:hypothetical protein [Legionella sp. MW5194]QRN04059.1 hypothetical protein GH742_09330 [Legionella sp. MW5194]